jgi:hypothetical protein
MARRIVISEGTVGKKEYPVYAGQIKFRDFKFWDYIMSNATGHDQNFEEVLKRLCKWKGKGK